MDRFLKLSDQLKSGKPIVVPGGGNITLTWDAEKKSTFGDYAKGFAVWIDGSLEQVPISFTPDGDGKPSEYNFILPNIDTLIFIL